MLNITTIKGATAAKNYYRSADYYVDDRELSPSWHGKLRSFLGLPHELHHNHFIPLCDNLHPHTGHPLTGAVKDDRDIGRDFTWSPPKSVTLAGLVGGDDRVIEAVNESVREAMGVIEADTMTRVRKGNVHEERRTGEMLWAMFPHLTTRPIKGEVDPQYHIHAVVFNLTHDPVERELKAIQFREVKRHAPYYQAVFQSKLAGKLQDMGYGIRKTKDAFEITTVPERAIKEFSRRRALIEKVVEDYGFTNPENIAKLGAKTRERKAEGQPWAKLLDGWEKRLSAQELDTLRQHPVPIHARIPDRSVQAVDYALKHLLERNSSVSQRELAKEALRYGMGDVTVEGVFKAIGKADLIRRELDGRLMVSSREVLNEENALVQFAIDGRGRFKPLGDGQRVKYLTLEAAGANPREASPAFTSSGDASATLSHPDTLPPFAQPVSDDEMLHPVLIHTVGANELQAGNHRQSDESSRLGGELSSPLSSGVLPLQAAEAYPDTDTLPPFAQPVPAAKPIKMLAVRRGGIEPNGAYFSTAGQSTYFDPLSDGVDHYDLGDVRIADTTKPDVAAALIRETLKDPALTPADRDRLHGSLKEAEQGMPFVDYRLADETPIAAAGKRLGYDGMRVWENDDISGPSSVFVWNVQKVRTVSERDVRLHLGKEIDTHGRATNSVVSQNPGLVSDKLSQLALSGMSGAQETGAARAETQRGASSPIKTRSNNFPHADQAVAGSTPPLATPESKLSPSQLAAIRHVWSSPDRIILVRGYAGSGKTTLTKTALAGIDLPTVVLAPSSEASRGVLRRDGFEGADTLARFLVDDKFQEKARNGLVWLDEASLAGGHDMARLVKLVDSLNARLVLSGDPRQHKSVARGDILTLLEEKAGLPAASVSEIQRQRGNYRKAVEKIAKGYVSDGFAILDGFGWIKEMAGEDKYASAAAEYVSSLKDGKTTLLVCPTHKEGDLLTERVRKEMATAGLLTGEERTFEVLKPTNWTEAERSDPRNYHNGHVIRYIRNGGGVKSGTKLDYTEELDEAIKANPGAFQVYERGSVSLRKGDTIRFTSNQEVDGHKVNNGSFYTVDGFDKSHIILNNGWKLKQDNGMFTSGLVDTSYAAQGKTVDNVIVVQGNQSLPASNMAQFYVSVSRGRKQASIYVDSKAETLEAVKRDDKRLLASDLVRRPRKKIRERLKKHIAFLRELPTLVGSKMRDVVRKRGMETYGHE